MPYTKSLVSAFPWSRPLMAFAVALAALVVSVPSTPGEVHQATAAPVISIETLDCVAFQCKNARATAVDSAGNIWVLAQRGDFNGTDNLKLSSLVKIKNSGTVTNPIYLSENVTTKDICYTWTLKADNFGNIWYADCHYDPYNLVRIDSAGNEYLYSLRPWSVDINPATGDAWVNARLCTNPNYGLKLISKSINGSYTLDSNKANCLQVPTFPGASRTGNGSTYDSLGNLWYLYPTLPSVAPCSTGSNGAGGLQKIQTAPQGVFPTLNTSYCPPTLHRYDKWLVADNAGNLVTGNDLKQVNSKAVIGVTTEAKITTQGAPNIVQLGGTDFSFRAAAAPNGDIWTMTRGCSATGVRIDVVSPTSSGGHELYATHLLGANTCEPGLNWVATDANSRFILATKTAIVIASVLHIPKLSAPTAVTASATTSTAKSLDVNWDAVANASSYSVKIFDSAGLILGTKTGIQGNSTTLTTSTHVSMADSTSYKVSVTAIGDAVAYDDSAESSQASATTNVNAVAPSISAHPSSVNRTVGQSATMSVTASASDGGTLSYQWLKGGTAISGQILNTYNISSIAASDAASYAVIVTNTISNGVSTSSTSTSATLTVAGALAIATPTTDLTGTANSAFSLAVAGSGGRASLTYALTGTLPSPLAFSTSTGTISGTPAAATSFTVSVRVTDANSATATTSDFTVAIGYASTTIGLSLATASPVYRTTDRITATTSRAGTVNFKLGGVSIDGCSAVVVASTTGFCDWVPVDLGAAQLTATFVPTSSTAYSNSTASLSPTVVTRSITITPTASQSKVFGDSEPVLTYTITSGSLFGLEALTGSLSRTASEDAGTYSITGGTLSNSNYTIAIAPVNFTVNKASQSAVQMTSVTGSYNTDLSLVATGGSGTGTYSFAVTTVGTAGCAITSGVLSASSPGTCTVTATRASNTNYLVASSIATTVTIGKATQAAVTLTSTSGTFNTNIALAASGGSGLGEYSFSVSDAGTAGCSISAGTSLASSSAGSCNVIAIRSGGNNYETQSSATTLVTFAKDTQNTMTMGDTTGDLDTGIALSVSGGSGIGAVSYSVTSGSASCSITSGVANARNAGTCSLTATKAADVSYLQKQVTNTLTFVKATQSVLRVTSTSGTFGAPILLTHSGGSGSGDVTYSVTDSGSASCSVSGSTLSFTSVGTCKVTVTKDSSSIFDSRSSTATTVTIERATQAELSLSTTTGDLYTGVIIAVTGGNGSGATTTTVTVGTAKCTVTSGVVTAKNTGTCTLTISKASDNSYLSASSNVVLTFTKAAPASGSIDSGTTGTAGTDITLSFTGGSGIGSVSYAVTSAGTAKCTITNGKLFASAAGTCTVTSTKKGDDTYDDQSVATEFTFTVGQAAVAQVTQQDRTVVTTTTTSTTTTTTTVAPTAEVAVANSKKATAPTTTTTTSSTTPPKPVLVKPSLVNTASATGAATIGGKTAKAKTTRVNNQLVFTAGGFTVTLAGVNPDGTVIPLSNAGLLEVRRGDTFRLNAQGFAPESTVEIWMFSKTLHLGTITIGADGLMQSTFKVPKSITDGLHHLVMVGVDKAEAEAKFEVGMNVGVPTKQWWYSRWLLIIPIMLAVFAGFWLPTTARRRTRKLI